ncbi:MAG: VWA domain-containing protein [Hellea sp.]|nr:VWA domain-containing protein [Hellea sp.]
MRPRRRNISIFSISALDLFAAALAAFLLTVIVLFEYYNKGGTDTSMEELEELVEKRRLAAATEQTDMSVIRALEAEINLLDKQYKTAEINMSDVEQKIQEVLKQTTEIVIPEPKDPDPEPTPKPIPTPKPEPPRSTNTGVEFSILGLGTNKKDIAIVVDMSGSMNDHRQNVVSALNEIVAQMRPDNRFVILGYRGGPTYSAYPRSARMETATVSYKQGAFDFINRMPRDFGGGTPTKAAIERAMSLNPEAIILLSDGEPTDGSPRSIVSTVTRRNSSNIEIHTVAIGAYTKNKLLTVFLQELARNNDGEFVGRAR